MEPWASHSLLEPCPAESPGMDLCLDRPHGVMLRCSVMAVLINEPPWTNRYLDVVACMSSVFSGHSSALCCWIFFPCSLTHNSACYCVLKGISLLFSQMLVDFQLLVCLVGATASTWGFCASIFTFSFLVTHLLLCVLSLQSQTYFSSLTQGTTSAWEIGPRHLRKHLPLCRFKEAPFFFFQALISFFFFFFTNCLAREQGAWKSSIKFKATV